jgi:hypothetical protein
MTITHLSAYADRKMSPCMTKPGFAIGLSKGLSWQGRRLALSRCIPLAAASLCKPNHFCPTNSASATTLFGVKSWWVIREPVHRLAVASPVGGASKLPPTPPWSGRLRSPLNPIDHAPAALKGVPAPWNPDHFMETNRAFAPLWKPTTNPMRIGYAPWYSP